MVAEKMFDEDLSENESVVVESKAKAWERSNPQLDESSNNDDDSVDSDSKSDISCSPYLDDSDELDEDFQALADKR